MTPSRGEFEAWARASIPELAEPGFAQIDIDELLEPAPPLAVAAGLAGVQQMRGVVAALGLDVDVMMVVPLEWSLDLRRDHPAFSDLVSVEWPYGPGIEVPGFYLLSPSIWRSYEGCEDYRRPIRTHLLPPGFVAYYRTWRAPEEEEKGYEYARCIYVRTSETE